MEQNNKMGHKTCGVSWVFSILAQLPLPGFVGGILLKSFVYIAYCSFVDRFSRNICTCIRHIEISVILVQILILQDDYHFEFS